MRLFFTKRTVRMRTAAEKRIPPEGLRFSAYAPARLPERTRSATLAAAARLAPLQWGWEFMKVCILSCSTGQGHNTAAKAVFEALTERGAECVFLDPFSLRGDRIAQRVANAYIRNAVLAPHLFGALYWLGGVISTSRPGSPVYWGNVGYTKELAAYLKTGGFDAAATSHLYPAEALTHLKRRGRLPIPFYTIMTDYDCSPFWEETRPDVCFTPSEEVSALCVARGMDPRVLFASGIPVRRSALERVGKEAARGKLGIEEKQRLVVVMGGSMGGGRMAPVIRELLACANGHTLVAAICGHNEALAKRIRALSPNDERLRVIGFTNEAPLWMEACDALLTKPGGLTSTEAAVMGVPLVLTAPIPGCETRNARYFERHGMAKRAFHPRRAAEEAYRLMDNEPAKHAMRAFQREGTNPRAADIIAERILVETVKYKQRIEG